MKLFSKSSIPVADLPKKSRPLSAKTLATQSFFHLTPVLCKDLYVGDKLNVRGEMFSRLLPLRSPSFTTSDNFLRAFFVPYQYVQPSFIDYMENTMHANSVTAPSIVMNNRFCTNKDFTRAFFGNSASQPSASTFAYTSGASATSYDFKVTIDGSTQYYFLTELGALIYKVLLGLGYDFTCNVGTGVTLDEDINMLPLMCYIRVFLDWYFPKNYFATTQFANLNALLLRDTGNEQLTTQDVRLLLSSVGYTFYTSEVFDECWDNPTGPNSGNMSSFSIYSSDYKINKAITDPQTEQPVLEIPVNHQNTVGYISKLGLNLLESLTDFLKRNQLAGSRSIDRFLARHGKKLDNDVVKRSYFLGQQRFTVGISDIAATIEDANNNLGDLAGKGISKGSCSFECFAGNHRGLFLVLLSTIPDSDLVQGMDKNVFKTTLLQHYQPEFAQRGSDIVSSAEVYVFNDSDNNVSGGVSVTQSGFGFLPAWYEYNMLRSRLLGDYRVKSRGGLANGILQNEHTFRLFDDSYFGGSIANVVHSLDFQKSSDRNQYYRLGYLSTASQDFERVFIEWSADFESSIPMVKDAYNFNSDAPHVGQSVDVQNSGVNLN